MEDESEQLLFRSDSERLVEIVGTQLYDVEHDRYFEVTRVRFVDDLYLLYGVPVTIAELTDDEP